MMRPRGRSGNIAIRVRRGDFLRLTAPQAARIVETRHPRRSEETSDD